MHLPRISSVTSISMHELHMNLLFLTLNSYDNGLRSIFSRLEATAAGEVGVTISRTDRCDGEPFIAELHTIEGCQSIVCCLALLRISAMRGGDVAEVLEASIDIRLQPDRNSQLHHASSTICN